jgi:hypothetical protein
MTLTEAYLRHYDADVEIAETFPQSPIDQADKVEAEADNELGLSPDELICRDRARRDTDVLEMFVGIGRLSLADKESLLRTGSRVKIIGSSADGSWDS